MGCCDKRYWERKKEMGFFESIGAMIGFALTVIVSIIMLGLVFFAIALFLALLGWIIERMAR